VFSPVPFNPRKEKIRKIALSVSRIAAAKFPVSFSRHFRPFLRISASVNTLQSDKVVEDFEKPKFPEEKFVVSDAAERKGPLGPDQNRLPCINIWHGISEAPTNGVDISWQKHT